MYNIVCSIYILLCHLCKSYIVPMPTKTVCLDSSRNSVYSLSSVMPGCRCFSPRLGEKMWRECHGWACLHIFKASSNVHSAESLWLFKVISIQWTFIEWVINIIFMWDCISSLPPPWKLFHISFEVSILDSGGGGEGRIETAGETRRYSVKRRLVISGWLDFISRGTFFALLLFLILVDLHLFGTLSVPSR